MFKRILSAMLCVVMIFTFTACTADKDVYTSTDDEVAEDVQPTVLNMLTGTNDISATAAQQRPVAIMINNVSTAQPVQTGVSKADIIYETEVEGGITRLLGVFSDISGIDKIGTVRSARYPYVDLALGHNAVYIHCGQDPTYCAPHLKDVDDINIDTNSKGAKRIANGLASEHTLYALGADLWENISGKFDTKSKNTTPWANFAAADETVTLDGGTAATVSVNFPARKSEFTYDEQSGLYTRLIGGSVQTDYFTGEKTQVKNIFILLTTITDYPDGVHRKVALESGDGYYITNGTVKFIKWSKGKASNGFTFTDTEGNDFKVSAGKSWVCIANKATCNPTIQ